MPESLPSLSDDDFSEWKNLRDVIMSLQNNVVNKEFKDVHNAPRLEMIKTPRGQLKKACLIQENDTEPLVLLRLLLYYIVLRKARDLMPPIYGMPVTTFQDNYLFTPQIRLYFKENSEDVEAGYSPVEGEITFRLINETSETIKKDKLVDIAKKIKELFGGKTPYKWNKGKLKCTYFDRLHGYDFRILARTEGDAKDLIGKILSIQEHELDTALLNFSQRDNPGKAFPVVTPAKQIYGKMRKGKRRRPIATVEFKGAQCFIHGINHPILLVDNQNWYRDILNGDGESTKP